MDCRLLSATLLMAMASLSACGDGAGKGEREPSRKEIAQQIDEVNRGPIFLLEPQVFQFPDIEKHKLQKVDCAFVPKGGGLGAVVLATSEDAFMKLRGEVRRFAADKGSAELPGGAYQRYFGREHAFTFKLDPAAGKSSAGGKLANYPAHITVEDGAGRIVYDTAGTAQCDG